MDGNIRSMGEADGGMTSSDIGFAREEDVEAGSDLHAMMAEVCRLRTEVCRLRSIVDPVQEACDDYLMWLDSDDYLEDNIHYQETDVLETVLKTVSGADVYDRINASLKQQDDRARIVAKQERLAQAEAEAAKLRQELGA